MRAVLRDRWADALCGDQYPQGFGQLGCITDEGVKEYCCLGVLAEVARAELEALGIFVRWVNRDLLVGSKWSVLPVEAVHALGLEDSSGTLSGRITVWFRHKRYNIRRPRVI
jgi:hypothetical protein